MKPITFADGIIMSRPTAKVRGTRHVVKMAKELKRFNHQVKALKVLTDKNNAEIAANYRVAMKERVLNFRSAMNSDEQEQWKQANDEEFKRFEDTETFKYVNKADIPKDRKIAYYNPQIKVKTSNGVTTYSVRGTIGGDKVDTIQA